MDRINRISTVGIMMLLGFGLSSLARAQNASDRPGALRFDAGRNTLGDVPSPPWNPGVSGSESRCRSGCRRDHSRQIAVESVAQPASDQLSQSVPRDLHVLAAQLQVATEVAADTIDFALPCGCMSDRMRGEAVQVVKRTRQFRKSVEQKAPVEQLRRDFEAVADSFVALARPLQQQSGSVLINRAMIRVDRTLAEIGKTLRPQNLDSATHSGMSDAHSGMSDAHSGMSGSMSHHSMAPHEHSKSTMSDSSAPHAHHQPNQSDSAKPLPLPKPPGTTAKPSSPRPVIPDDMKGIAQLPLEDQAAALAQKTCPITGGKLGAMGKPIKVDLGKRSVFVCCPGCVDEVKKNNPNRT